MQLFKSQEADVEEEEKLEEEDEDDEVKGCLRSSEEMSCLMAFKKTRGGRWIRSDLKSDPKKSGFGIFWGFFHSS